jgi:hypothetical protein
MFLRRFPWQRMLSLLGLVVSIIGTVMTQTQPQKHLDLRGRKAGVTNARPADLEEAFVSALHASFTPGGALILEKCRKNQVNILVPADATIEDALEIITSRDKDYSWTANDASVNLLPKFFQLSPLDIQISKFNVSDVLVSEAYRKLYETPEVRAGFAARNLQEPPGWQFVTGGVDFEKKRISIDLTNVTLRQTLNAIVEADGEKIWLINIRTCNGRNEYSTRLVN